MQHETSSSQLIKKRKEPQASEAGSFQLSQFGVKTAALRTTVKKIVVLTAFLSATVTANQAVVCDRAPSRRGLPRPANGTVARQNQPKNSTEGCDGTIVPRFIPLGDLN